MIRLPLGLLLFVLLLCSPVCAEEEYYEPVAPEDLVLIEQVAAGWPPKANLAALTAAMRLDVPEEMRDLGFGNAWRRYELYGEALSLWIDVVTWKSEVAGVRLHAMDAEPPMTEALHKAFGAGIREADGGASVRHEIEESMQRVREAAWTVLGKPPEEEPPEALRKAVRLLTDPLAELTVGTMCYEDGEPPEGRAAADLLHDHTSFDALHHVLVGPSPEGRAYAAEALVLLEYEGEVLDAKRRALLEEIRSLEIPIRTCGGCEVSDELAAALLAPERIAGHFLCHIVERATEGNAAVDVATLYLTARGRYTYRVHPRPGASSGSAVRPKRGILPRPLHEALQTELWDESGEDAVAGVPTLVIQTDDPEVPVSPAAKAALDHARSR